MIYGTCPASAEQRARQSRQQSRGEEARRAQANSSTLLLSSVLLFQFQTSPRNNLEPYIATLVATAAELQRLMDTSLTRVLSLIDQEYAELPSGQELAEKLKEKMTKTHESPPIAELEYLIQSGGYNLEDENNCMVSSLPIEVARSLLFDPSERQIKLYPLLLRRMCGEGDEACTETELALNTKATRVQPLFWALVYLVHRKSWKFLELFVLSGGLAAVSEMIGDDNLYVRGQAIEIMLSVTDCDVYDWFKKAGASENTRLLHTRLLSCYKDENFLKNLILNSTNSYPGGSMRCLQILAFFLSWMRAEYSDNETLRLSNSLLAVFYQWTKVDQEDKSDQSRGNERELAETLLKDFGKVESIENVVLDDFLDGARKEEYNVYGLSDLAEEFLAEGEVFRQEFSDRLRDGRKVTRQAGVPDMDSVKRIKEDANTLFKSKKYSEALILYERALETLVKVEENVGTSAVESKSDMEATLHFNKASTFWKLSQESSIGVSTSSSSSNPDDIDEFDFDVSLSDKIFELQRCEQACEAALNIDPYHIKAFFRLINAIIALGRPKEALHRVEMYEMSVDKDGNIDSDRGKILAELTRKCNASLILQSGSVQTAMESRDPDEIAKSILSSGASINQRTAKMLAKLNMRRRRENDNIEHAWEDWEPPIEQSDASGKNYSNYDEDVSVYLDSSTTEKISKSLDLEVDTRDKNRDKSKNRGNDGPSYSGKSKVDSCDVGIRFPLKKEKTKAEAKKDAAVAKSKKKSEFMKMVAGL